MIDYDLTGATGGRWYVKGNQVRAEDEKRDVPVCDLVFGCDAQRVSNARMIAESLAMLEILRSIGRDDDGDGMLDAAGMDRIEALIARIDGTPTAQPAGATGEAAPVRDWNSHAGTIEAAQGYVSDPNQWNPPSPRQVAHLLALSGISHGAIAPDNWDQEGEGE